MGEALDASAGVLRARRARRPTRRRRRRGHRCRRSLRLLKNGADRSERRAGRCARALAAAAAALGGSQRKRDAKKKRSDQKKSQDALGVSRRPFARCGAYALGSAGASCERFAATTWDGEHILVVVFASGEGVRLEHRARSAATLAPVAANPGGGSPKSRAASWPSRTPRRTPPETRVFSGLRSSSRRRRSRAGPSRATGSSCTTRPRGSGRRWRRREQVV